MTQQIKPQFDPWMRVFLQAFEGIALLGFLTCALVLLHGVGGVPMVDVLLYLVWFWIALVSLYAMLHGDKWGAYSLGAATALITCFDVLRGVGTWGGASLGLLVVLLIFTYLRNAPPQDA